MIIIFIYLFGALAVSFLCSVLEAVLLSTPVSFISMKENQGDKTASLMLKYKTNVDRPVAAILTLNTVAHTIGAAGVGSESVKVFGEAYFGIISAILTLLILVFSEIIPKTIGASYWRSLAMPSARIIRVLVFITYPLVWISELLTKCFSPKIQPLTVSREEVGAMVEVGTDEGVFDRSENRILQSFLKIADVCAEEIMTPFFFSERDRVSDIWQRLLERKEHISVITDEYGCMRGIVTMEDVIESMLGVEIVDECDTTEDLQAMAREKFSPDRLNAL